MKGIRETFRHIKDKTLEKVAVNEGVNADNYVWFVAIAFLSAVVVPFAIDKWRRKRDASRRGTEHKDSKS